jgi:hypothetical protein
MNDIKDLDVILSTENIEEFINLLNERGYNKWVYIGSDIYNTINDLIVSNKKLYDKYPLLYEYILEFYSIDDKAPTTAKTYKRIINLENKILMLIIIKHISDHYIFGWNIYVTIRYEIKILEFLKN